MLEPPHAHAFPRRLLGPADNVWRANCGNFCKAYQAFSGEHMAEAKHIKWNDIEVEAMSSTHRPPDDGRHQPDGRARPAEEGRQGALHSHHNEQVTYILEGALHFFIDNKELTVSAGEVLCIPPNMPHEAIALEDTVDLDIFTPPRQDWLNKEDAYLRQEAKK